MSTIIRLKQLTKKVEAKTLEPRQIFFINRFKCILLDNDFIDHNPHEYVYYTYWDEKMKQNRLGYCSKNFLVTIEAPLPEPVSLIAIPVDVFFLIKPHEIISGKFDYSHVFELSDEPSENPDGTNVKNRFNYEIMCLDYETQVIPLSAEHLEIVDLEEEGDE